MSSNAAAISIKKFWSAFLAVSPWNKRSFKDSGSPSEFLTPVGIRLAIANLNLVHADWPLIDILSISKTAPVLVAVARLTAPGKFASANSALKLSSVKA